MALEDLSDDDWTVLQTEARRIFTPSTPIGAADLFAGRQQQLRTLINTIAEPGRHAIMYGEPGVGKTSMAQMIQYLLDTKISRIRFYRETVFSNDTYSDIWRRIFSRIFVTLDESGNEREVSLSSLYDGEITQGIVVQELDLSFTLNDIPIICIDEFNLLKNEEAISQLSETIKALSDKGANITIIVVGVSDSVADLVRGHQSIIRCSEEILMPRMSKDELREVIDKRIANLGMKIEREAKWKVINLSIGLPSFTHALGRTAVLNAIHDRRLLVTDADVDNAIASSIRSSQNTLKTNYEYATNSNNQRARFRKILTTCALAKADESGYFTPRQVQIPLENILGKPTGIDAFHQCLKEFSEEKRGEILQIKGSDRNWRYRFRNPAMQPFAIMKAIEEGYLDEGAKRALASDDQPDLFST